MSMKNQSYNPMCEDGYDNKIPLHNDDAFQHGIQFKVKVKFEMNLIKKKNFFFCIVCWVA
jgi:hypothetical protein